MEQKNTQGRHFGFISADGYFGPINTLSTAALEYVGKSSKELNLLLLENMQSENYEVCAIIRDEIKRRNLA